MELFITCNNLFHFVLVQSVAYYCFVFTYFFAIDAAFILWGLFMCLGKWLRKLSLWLCMPSLKEKKTIWLHRIYAYPPLHSCVEYVLWEREYAYIWCMWYLFCCGIYMWEGRFNDIFFLFAMWLVIYWGCRLPL